MGHGYLALVAEHQVASTRQLIQALGHRRGLGPKLPAEFVRSGRAPRFGERAVHGQPQVLAIHTAIFAKRGRKPMSKPTTGRLSYEEVFLAGLSAPQSRRPPA
jgi:hypothetical protein